MSDNKRIAKNTLFLYIRMTLIMGVTLYTSRIVLDKLGVEDYGLYNVVGGVVGMLSFLSGTLSNGTSRFITFAIGVGDNVKLKETFSTTFYSNLGLGLIIVLLLETGGLWFVNNKLLIPTERFNVALLVYQISIATMLISILQVTYTAAIIAHEKMSIYAYISIFEAMGKLGIVYMISNSIVDKLVMYAMLLLFIQTLLTLIYAFYCHCNYMETKLSLLFNKSIFNEVLKFSSWNVIAQFLEILKFQGVIVLMNMFFFPAIVGAQAIANQVGNAIMQFVGNFRTAINPQIIKQYAAGDFESSRKLTLSSTLYSYELVLIIAIPALFLMDKVLSIWLVEVPDYAVIFTQWVIMQRSIGVIDASLYAPMMASGKIKTNSLAAVFFGIVQFLVLYYLLKIGFGVMWIQYMMLFVMIMYSFVIKPYIICREIDYKISEIIQCFKKCIFVTVLALIIPFIGQYYINKSDILQCIAYLFFMVVGVIISSIIVMDKTERRVVKQYVIKSTKLKS